LSKNNKIQIPDSLVEDTLKGDVILFLGAGASTEGTSSHFEKLIDVLAEKCQYPSNMSRTLPKVCQYFCKKMDAGKKGRLLREIRRYFDFYMEDDEAKNQATKVHKRIATIGLFKIIITTNWDVFMERQIDVLPVVNDSDLVYWNDSRRQLIKLHGCISQPNTMVMTEKDYESFLKKRLDSTICTKVRDLMATKTFLFLGYSLKDSSFEALQEYILSKMGKYTRCSYAVLPNPTNEDIESAREKGIEIIPSKAFDLVWQLRSILVKKNLYFSINLLGEIDLILEEIKVAQRSLSNFDDLGLYSELYQDGLKSGLQELSTGISSGKSKSHFNDRLRESLNSLNREKKLNKDSEVREAEIAYLTGRVECLRWALGKQENLNYFLNMEFEPITEKDFDYLRELNKDKQLNRL
jgi:hypothetical protein